ncbi:Sentrin-specific protease 8 [Trichoplax sp. H2]|uniref:Ubiquitin-like protease family profile domain-containing protein n=1 Tax=Trichoplax adhaerens TaxID=10228 RepID=B3RIN5_TRIAD|nr:hypothetical protein TRIADDRAFT_52470 [Trichoplax adhaerens]EDV29750.1 hypothetical protein TRIADDRAFT_52470 [Trichoplax adhaerens]RDD47246.1 Sentrin-specific protease 8 [Trichoplax sp. H2]|eukprot:XP_002108952.1 hypothetical protein TRIADDRAFT_52470 [Trichoplax adhaerens]
MAANNPCILSYYDSIIREDDLQILNGIGWISDRIIGFVLEYFERELFASLHDVVAFVQPEISQFIKLCDATVLDSEFVLDSLNLSKKELIFLPVNDHNKVTEAGGSHWTLLIYIRPSNCYLHMDSLCTSSNLQSAKITAYKLDQVLKYSSNTNFTEIKNGPRQVNGYDCGMYVICEIESICKKYKSENDIGSITDQFGIICRSLTPEMIHQKRLELSSLIISLRLKSA